MTDFLNLINYEKRLNSMSFAELMAEGNRLIARVRALDNKEKSKRLACQARSKSLPKNATIRKGIAVTSDMVHTITPIGKILLARD
jgi:hypothetical protein